MQDVLQVAIEMDITEYSSLIKPVFVGQTSMDDNGNYWVVVECQGCLYKFHMSF